VIKIEFPIGLLIPIMPLLLQLAKMEHDVALALPKATTKTSFSFFSMELEKHTMKECH
jgi:hypothetical protein